MGLCLFVPCLERLRSLGQYGLKLFKTVPANQTEESEVRELFRELVPQPLFDGVVYTICKQNGVLEPVPDSFPETSRTSLSSVWFAGTIPELFQMTREWPISFNKESRFAHLT